MTSMEEQWVFIVDDDAAVRDSIVELVESVGMQPKTYSSAAEFLEAFRPECRGCLVLDVRMAEMSGLELQQRLNELGASLPVIMLTGHADIPMAIQAMKAGAVDFLQKPYRDQSLLDSINSALTKDAVARRACSKTNDLEQYLATLTEREREVLVHMLEGNTSKVIARALEISPRTVEAHRHNLMQKLKVGSITELMLLHTAIQGEDG